jgi:hypothetical protein
VLQQYRFSLAVGPIIHANLGPTITNPGTIEVSGSCQEEHRIIVYFGTDGQAATANWAYYIDGVSDGVVHTGAGTIGSTGITVTPIDGAASNSFLINSAYHFTTQWRGRIDEIIRALCSEFQELEDAMWDVFILRLLQNDTPFGDLLDKFGEIVGQPRNGFTDAEYLPLVKARIATNRSDGKRETLIHITFLLTNSPTVWVQEYIGAVQIDALVDGDSPPPNIVAGFLIDAVVAGVRMFYKWSGYDSDNTFTLSSDYGGAVGVDSQGYGSDYDASAGGHYAGVFAGPEES